MHDSNNRGSARDPQTLKVDLAALTGNITIAGTVTRVTAKRGVRDAQSIGAGRNGRCGTVIIEDETKVTLN